MRARTRGNAAICPPLAPPHAGIAQAACGAFPPRPSRPPPRRRHSAFGFRIRTSSPPRGELSFCGDSPAPLLFFFAQRQSLSRARGKSAVFPIQPRRKGAFRFRKKTARARCGRKFLPRRARKALCKSPRKCRQTRRSFTHKRRQTAAELRAQTPTDGGGASRTSVGRRRRAPARKPAVPCPKRPIPRTGAPIGSPWSAASRCRRGRR